MEYRAFGTTGISISAVGFGCGGVGGLFVHGTFDEQVAAVQCALDGGINYFDTAAQYGEGRSERNLGKVLRALDVSPIVGTKVMIRKEELPHVATLVPERLREGLDRLGMESIDVCTLHSSVGSPPHDITVADVNGPVAEAMHAVVDAGLAQHIGYTGLGDTAQVLEVARGGHYSAVQCFFNVLNPSAAFPGHRFPGAQDFGGLIGVAASHGLGTTCIRVLAGGAFSESEVRHEYAMVMGKSMVPGEEYEDNVAAVHALRPRMGELGVSSMPELAIRYVLSERRLSTVLIGVSSLSHVEQALAAEALGPLSPEALAVLKSHVPDPDEAP